MEEICMNCEYFVVKSFDSSEHVWGDCVKPKEDHAAVSSRKEDGTFTWADKTCRDFEPKKKTSVKDTGRR